MHPSPQQEARKQREQAVAEPIERRHRLGAVVEPVAADDIVALVDKREKRRELLHWVGVVAVGGDDDRPVGREQRRPDRHAVALWLLFDDAGAVFACYLRGAVLGAVDADDLGFPVGHPLDVGQHRLDCLRLVVGPHHDAEVLEPVLH